ncbi:MAG: FecR domain-containing protein [Mangrovibacterium sp.]|nr:FecR domain-containing protein [Mangrovibacterium sp.]
MKLRKEILIKYLRGYFSLNEKAVVDEYFASERFDTELTEVLREHWDELNTGKAADRKDLSPVLDKISHELSLRRVRRMTTLKLVWRWYAKAAAILLVPVLIATFYRSRTDNPSDAWIEIHSPYGAQTRFTLPDGSSGWLNSGSVIKYPLGFCSERTVRLDGEAYFDVMKNPGSPFTVHTGSVDVNVTGTSFNVVSYDTDSLSEIVVTSGKIEVLFGKGKAALSLLPDERLVYHRQTGNLVKSVVDVQGFTSWKTGKLIFLNDNLDEAVRKIARFYHAKIRVDPEVDRNQSFRAIVEKESVEEVLRYMKLTMNLDYAVHEQKSGSGGVIEGKKIVITSPIEN